MDLKNTGCDVAYDHIGIPTIHPSEGEVYHPDICAHILSVKTDALRIEKIRFDADAPFPDDVKTRTHVAFKVDSLSEAIFGKQIVMPPTEFKPGIRFAFVDIEGVLIEFFEIG
ncbi:VOC family protein [Rhodopirellula bahusiensis]|uniref:VOC family protein n=1 Tax=Rhodopirellula bahusiensis TaxID=2014065 RepID=UPI000685A2E5|nr:glyoxalase/bleomycin resistance/dioxygenase family protein [Rhodopirellula bahusiensis]